MRVFLVRHGQTEWNDQKRVQGHTDVHLDSRGKEQASLLGEALSKEGIERILTSDLMRAKDTAEIVGLRIGLPIELSSKLRERSFGEWEGFTYEVFTGRFGELTSSSDQDPHSVAPPGGESLMDLRQRLKEVAEDIVKRQKSTLVVSHGGACGILLCELLQIPQSSTRKFRFDNAAITEINFYRDGNRSLIRHNDSSHFLIAKTLSSTSP